MFSQTLLFSITLLAKEVISPNLQRDAHTACNQQGGSRGRGCGSWLPGKLFLQRELERNPRPQCLASAQNYQTRLQPDTDSGTAQHASSIHSFLPKSASGLRLPPQRPKQALCKHSFVSNQKLPELRLQINSVVCEHCTKSGCATFPFYPGALAAGGKPSTQRAFPTTHPAGWRHHKATEVSSMFNITASSTAPYVHGRIGRCGLVPSQKNCILRTNGHILVGPSTLQIMEPLAAPKTRHLFDSASPRLDNLAALSSYTDAPGRYPRQRIS